MAYEPVGVMMGRSIRRAERSHETRPDLPYCNPDNMQIVDSISTETAPDAEKNELPWLKECWCIPPNGSG